MLRANLIAAGNGLIQDVVITGHDNEFIGAIVFASLSHCKNITDFGEAITATEIVKHKAVKEKLKEILDTMAIKSTGSASLIKRAVFADFNLNIDKGEITDKGSVNQRIVIQNYPEVVEKIYSALLNDDIIEIKNER
jgi:feruloyl-CoA synthase